jgi:hypothetical protein
VYEIAHSVLFTIVTIFTSPSFARTHDPQTTQPATIFSSQMEAERKQLLTRAERGHKHAQMWLGASFEQGRFGKIDFQQALKWFRKAAAQGDPDASALDKCTKMGRECIRIMLWLLSGTAKPPSTFQTSGGQVKVETIWAFSI